MPLDTLPHSRLEPDHASDTGACSALWSVVQTNPQAERWAASNLSRAGYPVYLPLVRIRRRDPVTRSVSRLVDVPLFPGYLFVIVGTHWAPVRYVQGVLCRHPILLVDGRPGYLRCGFVEALRATDESRRSVAQSPAWIPGAACQVASGAFAGHPAVITAVAGHTARVGVMMFGAVREVSVPLDALEPR